MQKIIAANMQEPFNQRSRQPRDVSLFARACALFGGSLNQLGFIFFGLGMIFIWLVIANVSFLDLWGFRGDTVTVQGNIAKTEKTGLSQGKGKGKSSTPIFANHYRFQYEGREYEGVSYATGDEKKIGDTVQIEFSAGNPTKSRIVGMRSAPLSPLALLVGVFPLVGAVLAYIGLRSGYRAQRLLVIGELTRGKLVSKQRTNASVNKRQVYKLGFEFMARDGKKYVVHQRSHQPESLEDEATELILYDSSNPSYAYLRDAIPGGVSVAENGQIIFRSGAGAVLVIPSLVILGHLLYALRSL